MIGVVEVGLGNSASVHNMLRRVGAPSKAVSTPDDLNRVNALILPGVGAFDTGIRNLDQAGLLGPIQKFATGGQPLLGICLGMHLLCGSSEEGQLSGIGAFPHKITSLRNERPASRVPHVGWEVVKPIQGRGSTLLDDDPYQRFYFTHSYAAPVMNGPSEIYETDFDGTPFAAVLEKENVTAVQFHPEKSHRFGMQVLRNFWEKRCSVTA